MEAWDEIADDIKAVFGFEKGKRPQDRAHAYIKDHELTRGYDDTALQVAVTDLCRRAYEVGYDLGAQSAADGRANAARMIEDASELIANAARMIGGEL